MPQSKKKREAERQITSDDPDDDAEDQRLVCGTFEKADEDKLRSRRMWNGRSVPPTARDGGVENEKKPQFKKMSETEHPIDPPVKKRCAVADGALAGDGGRVETENAVVAIGRENRVAAKDSHRGETSGEEEGEAKEEQQSKNNEETRNPFANVYFASASSPTILPIRTPAALPFATDAVSSTATGNGSATFGSAAGFGTNSTTHSTLGFNAASTAAFGSSAASDDTTTYFFGGGAAVPSSKTLSSFNSSSPFSTTEGEADDIANDDDRDAVLAASAVVSNGEEEEECIFQTRAKLFKFVPVVKGEEEEEKKEDSGGIASGPPASTMGTVSHNISYPNVFDKKTSMEVRGAKSKGEETKTKVAETEIKGGETETKDGEAENKDGKTEKKGGEDENKDGETETKDGDADKKRQEDSKSQEKAKDSKSVSENKMYYKEIGIGPVRLLRKKSDQAVMRIVQRRESTPGGPGTKVILNIPLRLECKVLRQADKFVKLGTPEVVDAAQPANITVAKYLFKVKTVADANALEMALKDGIAGCYSV